MSCIANTYFLTNTYLFFTHLFFTHRSTFTQAEKHLFKTGKMKTYALKHVTQFLFLFRNNIYSFNINILLRKLTLYAQ